MSDWIITPEARLIYPNLASPRTITPKPGERVKAPQYQVTLVIPAASTQSAEFQALMQGAMNAFIAANGAPAWQQAVQHQFHPKVIQWPFTRLGDPGSDPEGKYAAAGFQPGDIIIRAKNELKPDVCKARAGMKSIIVQPTEARGGYWVKVAVSFWSFGVIAGKGNAPGVSINLGPVMITREDVLITMGGASAGDAGAIFGAESGADTFAGTTSFAPPPSQAPAPAFAPPPQAPSPYMPPQAPGMAQPAFAPPPQAPQPQMPGFGFPAPGAAPQMPPVFPH